eukprot:293958-Rhodomonas_salina.1
MLSSLHLRHRQQTHRILKLTSRARWRRTLDKTLASVEVKFGVPLLHAGKEEKFEKAEEEGMKEGERRRNDRSSPRSALLKSWPEPWLAGIPRYEGQRAAPSNLDLHKFRANVKINTANAVLRIRCSVNQFLCWLFVDNLMKAKDTQPAFHATSTKGSTAEKLRRVQQKRQDRHGVRGLRSCDPGTQHRKCHPRR